VNPVQRDTLYDEPCQPVRPFVFDRPVAAVFDDMARRSIPFYGELIQRQAQMIPAFYQAQSRIYDLGCSTGNLGAALCRAMGETPFTMVSVDNSEAMLAVYDARRRKLPGGDRIRLRQDDVSGIAIENASVVVINFTLQFLPLAERDLLVDRVYRGLRPGGVLLFSEKIVHADDGFNALQQDFYHRFKRENGYSEMAIAQKREALEKVLIPETVGDHLKRVTGAGFRSMDIWLKWFNFCSWMCRK
jgi:tRNA (cmo5U34)-methyltransferase